MSIRTSLIAVALPLALILQPSAGVNPQEHSSRMGTGSSLDELAWLAGDWSGDMWGGKFNAYYTTPEGGKIISHSRLTHGSEVSFYEFEVFEAHEETVRLQPYPEGKPASSFLLKSHEPATFKAVFENPENDYPKRIVYQRASPGNLVITLSDPFGGSDKVETFDLKRVGTGE